MGTVVFGPYMGELGHEVRTWAPYCQAIMQTMPEGTRFHAISWPGRAVLYPGCVFHTWSPPFGIPEWMTLKNNKQFDWAWIKDRIDYDQIYMPKPGGKAALALYPKQKFMISSVKPWTLTPIKRVAVIARNRTDLAADRNYPHWDALCAILRTQYPQAQLVAIGTMQGNLCPAGTEDFRWPVELAHSLQHMADVIGVSDFVIGESSGPMHFALSMCGRPVSVLCKPGIAARYEGPDNWWDVPVHTQTAKDFEKVTPAMWLDGLPPTLCPSTLEAGKQHG